MAAVVKIPSLDALPLPGVDDDLQSVVEARAKLQASFTMVGQILAAPSGVPAELRNQLNNVKFHITTGLSAIDNYLYMGNPSTSAVGDVPNWREAIKGHIAAIRQAKPAWDNWLTVEKPPEAPLPLLKESALDPAAATAAIDKAANTSGSSALESMSSPTPLRTYLVIGGIAVGAIMLMKIMK
jgi:hypothetical protein